MLERRIRFKDLETRLQQLWMRKGIIHIVDLGQDFFLVTFTCEEDQDFALLEGPWMIYDHYLTAREWGPNFYHARDAIEELAV